jgi:hypothetical protein
METPIEYLEREYVRLYNGIVKISMLSSFETAKKMEQELNQVKNSIVLADVSNNEVAFKSGWLKADDHPFDKDLRLAEALKEWKLLNDY